MNVEASIVQPQETTCCMPQERHIIPPDKQCVPQETEITNVQLAHAYVPFQKLCETFEPLEGLIKGTIFPPLYDVYGWESQRMGG